jgi:hypothetical protein
MAEAFKNLNHADAGARIQRVHKTRDEKRDGHAWQFDGKFKKVFLTPPGKVSLKKSGKIFSLLGSPEFGQHSGNRSHVFWKKNCRGHARLQRGQDRHHDGG